MPVQYSDSELLFQCDLYNPSTGIIRHVALLNSSLQLNVAFSANATSNVLTFTVAQPFQTGGRIRVASTATLPTPLVAGVDYFVIRLTATTFKLATTLANAIGATEIDLMDAGGGTLTAIEQALIRTDPIAVLLSKEYASFPGYTARLPVTDVGPALIVLAKAQKSKTINITNSGTVDITIGYCLIIRGGSATIGDAVMAGSGLEIFSSPMAVIVGETKGINFVMRGA